jgi:FtsP/CotA-like multicopper oxidase with cupredoxin domain
MVFFEKQATTFSLLVAATLTTLGSYQASAQTWQKSVSADVQRARCQKLETMFKSADGKVQYYRPLVTMAPQRTAIKPDTLSLDINARIGLRSSAAGSGAIAIGNYQVIGVPIWEISPKLAALTTAYVIDPLTGHRCSIERRKLQDVRFQRDWIYSGVLLDLQQRDVLKTTVKSTIAFKNDPKPDTPANGGVPCQATNQHTHGLLVNPYNSNGSRGDYVFDLAVPKADAANTELKDACGSVGAVASHAHGVTATALEHQIRIPNRAADPGDALKSGNHPSGLFWFHPHGHGYSSYQVRGGTTGLINVGRVDDTIGGRPSGKPNRPENVRYMMLKDTQLLAGKSGGARIFAANYTGKLCGEIKAGKHDASETRTNIFANGECTSVANESTQVAADGRWVFTINGVQYPRIADDVDANETEVWRLANASANVSYRLVLYPKGADGSPVRDATKRKLFQVAAVDGVTVNGGATSTTTRRVEANEVFLMPGSRATIILPPDPGMSYVLVSEIVETGGDVWPAVALAEVTWPGRPPKVAVTEPTRRERARASWVATRGPVQQNTLKKVRDPAAVDSSTGICDLPKGAERVILFVKRLKEPGKDDAPEVFGLVAGLRRQGESDLTKAIYFQGPTTLDHAAMGHAPEPQGAKKTTTPPPFSAVGYKTVDWSTVKALFDTPVMRGQSGVNLAPAYGQGQALSQVCTKLGRTETWVVENWTDEIHNIHIHQSQFAISFEASKPYFDAPYPYTPGKPPEEQMAVCGDRSKDPGVTETDCTIASRYLNMLQNAHQDSVPIPRGRGLRADGTGCTGVPGATTDCVPARVSLTISFNRQEQVGRFPFHCHILEHEDLGMMGEIAVLK